MAPLHLALVGGGIDGQAAARLDQVLVLEGSLGRGEVTVLALGVHPGRHAGHPPAGRGGLDRVREQGVTLGRGDREGVLPDLGLVPAAGRRARREHRLVAPTPARATAMARSAVLAGTAASLSGAAAKPQLPSTSTRTPIPIDFSSRSSGSRSSWWYSRSSSASTRRASP